MLVPELPVETVPLVRLQPHPKNYRRHPENQLLHIEASLREHGQYRPIVVARDNTILAGHGVYEAARRIPLDTVDIVRIDVDPDEPRAIKILTGDNELGRLAEVDDRLLSEHLRTIAEIDDLIGTGYDERMLAALVYVTRPETEIPTLDHAAEWSGMPTFEGFQSPYRIVVSVDSPEEREKVMELLGIEVVNRKDRETWSVRWPPRQKEDLSSLFIDGYESEKANE